MKRRNFEDIKDQIRPGDIIAFGGRGFVSWVIKLVTGSPVSHCGIMLRSSKLIESTTLTKRKGVMVRNLAERIKEYDGEVWWLSLREDIRGKLNVKQMYDYLMKQVGKEYDTFQAVLSAIILWTFESDKYFFCSELCARGLEVGGAWSGNASEMTPRDIVCEDLYRDIVQIHGDERDIF